MKTLTDVIEEFNAVPVGARAGFIRGYELDDRQRPQYAVGYFEPVGHFGEVNLTLRVRLLDNSGDITYEVGAFDPAALAEAAEKFLALLIRPR